MENKPIIQKTDVTRRDFFKSTGILASGLLLTDQVNAFAGMQDKALAHPNLTPQDNQKGDGRMIIDSIEIYRVKMGLIYPFRTANENADTIETILIKMTSGDFYAWGESTPWQSPFYSYECASTAFIVIRNFLAPLLLGQDIQSGDQLQQKLSGVKGNNFAKAALDHAWWELYSKMNGIPLYKALGGTRCTVDVGADFGIMENIDLLLKTIDTAVKAGFKRIKLKFRPGWELDMISAVRKAFPTTVFHVDCNNAYTLDNTEMLKHLDEYNLAMIEQPLTWDDLIDHATLQKQLKTPICLDESITTVARARKAIAIGACGWINIKSGRVGGLTVARKIHDLCQSSGIPCWVGGMLESSVGAHQCMALATLPNFKYPADIFPTDRFFLKDLSDPPVILSGTSQVTCPEVPGCGAEPNLSRLLTQTIEKITLKS
jgi:o-succinylbenzoate synthase